jgi:uncharacterized membrane protein AbrB (regulator of aidB expression)
MAVLGNRFGARVDRVAAAQSLRIVLVVLIVPAAFTPSTSTAPIVCPRRDAFRVAGLGCLMLATLAGSGVAMLLRLPNAFVLGSLFVAIPSPRARSTGRRFPRP